MNHSTEPDCSKVTTLFFAFLFFTFAACNNNSADPLKEKTKDSTDKAVKEEKTVWMPALDTAANKKTIYLTFDDGPNFGSSIVMNIARQEEIPISFFVIGTHEQGSPLQKRLWKEMHTSKYFELCNHSYTHALNNRYRYFYDRPDTVLYDFQRNEDSLRFTNKIIRTPGNSLWRMPKVNASPKMTKVAGDLLYSKGFLGMGWDWEWEYRYSDLKLKQSAEQLYQQMEQLFASGQTRIPNHLVLLAHDLTFRDPADSASLHQFVKLLKANPNYQLAFPTQYPGLK
jgi:peptidoglycan-N-acetylglucosamine deacetylase